MFDLTKIKMSGVGITDTIRYTDGRVEVIERDPNLVVDSVIPLIMSLLKRETGYLGIQYWAVGSGATSWDSSMPSPTLKETTLTKEIGRKAISTSDISFLDPNLLTKVSTPTNLIEITVTFGTNECNGVWREFGLFGGKATTALNSGHMINKKHHSILTKTTDMTVERNIQLSLTF